jgi:hypothetical protein
VAYVCCNGLEVCTIVWSSHATVSFTLNSTKPQNPILHTLLVGLNRSYRCENLRIVHFLFVRTFRLSVCRFYHGNQIYLHHQTAALNLSARS